MGSLIDELQRRQAVACEEAEELRGQIAQLTQRLGRVEERLSGLILVSSPILLPRIRPVENRMIRDMIAPAEPRPRQAPPGDRRKKGIANPPFPVIGPGLFPGQSRV